MTAQEVKIEELEEQLKEPKIRFGKLPEWKFKGWQVVFFFWVVPDPELPVGLRLGWKTILFGIFKVKELPPEGQEIKSENIRGFILQGQAWFPFDRFGKL